MHTYSSNNVNKVYNFLPFSYAHAGHRLSLNYKSSNRGHLDYTSKANGRGQEKATTSGNASISLFDDEPLSAPYISSRTTLLLPVSRWILLLSCSYDVQCHASTESHLFHVLLSTTILGGLFVWWRETLQLLGKASNILLLHGITCMHSLFEIRPPSYIPMDNSSTLLPRMGPTCSLLGVLLITSLCQGKFFPNFNQTQWCRLMLIGIPPWTL